MLFQYAGNNNPGILLLNDLNNRTYLKPRICILLRKELAFLKEFKEGKDVPMSRSDEYEEWITLGKHTQEIDTFQSNTCACKCIYISKIKSLLCGNFPPGHKDSQWWHMLWLLNELQGEWTARRHSRRSRSSWTGRSRVLPCVPCIAIGNGGAVHWKTATRSISPLMGALITICWASDTGIGAFRGSR